MSINIHIVIWDRWSGWSGVCKILYIGAGVFSAPALSREPPKSSPVEPKRRQVGPRRRQVCPKRCPRGAKLSPRGAKLGPRGASWAQEAPSWAQVESQRSQVEPKRRQVGPKRRQVEPKRHQVEPKRSQVEPKLGPRGAKLSPRGTNLGAILFFQFWRSSCVQGPNFPRSYSVIFWYFLLFVMFVKRISVRFVEKCQNSLKTPPHNLMAFVCFWYIFCWMQYDMRKWIWCFMV